MPPVLRVGLVGLGVEERMKNTNWLAGIRCPECGARGPFWIQARVHAEVYDARIAQYKDPEWDDDSYISCESCGHAGLVIHFAAEAEGR